MNQELIGKVILYYDRQAEIIGIHTSKGIEYYLLNDEYPNTENRSYPMETEERMQYILDKQNDWKEQQEQRKQREIREAEEERKEAEQKAIKENLYGFTDSLTPMKQGKVLKCLMTMLRHNNKTVTRKEYIIALLNEGCTPIEKDYSNYRTGNEAHHYCMVCDDKSWYEVTKTEYDFAKYLLNNNILASIA